MGPAGGAADDPELLADLYPEQADRLSRMPNPDSTSRFTLADHRDYTVPELREICRDRGITVPQAMTHRELVAVISGAGVELPAKPLQRRTR